MKPKTSADKCVIFGIVSTILLFVILIGAFIATYEVVI